VKATWPRVSRLRRSQRRPTLLDLANQCADQAKQLGVLRAMTTSNQEVPNLETGRPATGRGVRFVQDQDIAIIQNKGPPVPVGTSIELSRGLLH
jgi:hypothetical protein